MELERLDFNEARTAQSGQNIESLENKKQISMNMEYLPPKINRFKISDISLSKRQLIVAFL